MRRVIAYLFVFLALLIGSVVVRHLDVLPESSLWQGPAFDCVLVGGLGGCLYCLRGVYLNYSALDQWDDRWIPWYYLRPVVSCIVGLVAFVFLKAGLLVLESEPSGESTQYGFLAVAFLAGYNVDRFLERIEGIGKSVFGVKPSRTAELGSQSQQKDNSE